MPKEQGELKKDGSMKQGEKPDGSLDQGKQGSKAINEDAAKESWDNVGTKTGAQSMQ